MAEEKQAVQEPTEGAAQPKGKTPAKVEIAKNCGACKKPVRKLRYYRNMQFFCNRKCWEDFMKSAAKAKEKEAEAKQA